MEIAMKWVLALALGAAAACSSTPAGVHFPPRPPLSDAEMAEIARSVAANRQANEALFAEMSRPVTQAEMDLRAQRDRNAEIICRARGNSAGAMPAFGGFSLSGAIAAGMQQGWAAASVEQNCIEAYRATGVLPAL